MESTTIQQPHRQGDFLRIPQVRPSSAVAYLVVNCVIPGLGTVISSWTDVEYSGWDWAVFLTGIIQFGLAWIIIGWAWSIWWGVRILQDAQEREKRENGPISRSASINNEISRQEEQTLPPQSQERVASQQSINSDQGAV